MEEFGDRLFQRARDARQSIFTNGEFTTLAYHSFDKYITLIGELNDDPIKVILPVGMRDDESIIEHPAEYEKEWLTQRYKVLSFGYLPLNGIYHLVTIVEIFLSDILREIFLQFPEKLPNKKMIDYETVLKSKNIEEVKSSLINSFIHELTYKSPKDFAREFDKYTGTELENHNVYNRYIEIKATRDICIHNYGFINSIYLNKTENLARGKEGEMISVDNNYYLKSYEVCLKLTEIIDSSLHKKWPSNKYLEAKAIIQ